MDRKLLNTVTALCEIAATVATVYMIIHVIGGRDAQRRISMKLAQTSEHFCQQQAMLWAHAADSSKKVYDSKRLVTL